MGPAWAQSPGKAPAGHSLNEFFMISTIFQAAGASNKSQKVLETSSNIDLFYMYRSPEGKFASMETDNSISLGFRHQGSTHCFLGTPFLN